VGSLDILRFVAVSLVVVQHYPSPRLLLHYGWTGVDLFFVLSGFLVSGLLFSEYRARGDVDAKRFLVRRGFKIYPPFWSLIAITCAGIVYAGGTVPLKNLFCELAFVQNYGPGLWVHTWSLAVEEHFYFGVAGAFVAWRSPGIRSIILRIPPHIRVLAVPVGVIVVRCFTVALVPARFKLLGMGTHARIDALFSGATIAYFYHAHPEELEAFVRRFRWALGAGALLLLVPLAFVAPWTPFLETIGFTNVYLAFDAVLLLTLYAPQLRGDLPLVPRGMASLGRFSYGTYLWHVPLEEVVLRQHFPRLFSEPSLLGFVVFLALSFAVGIVSTKIVEAPSLRFRDKVFPARATAL
jgi:peptidoglycan/LPS O-acetylase OafA/YrhL